MLFQVPLTMYGVSGNYSSALYLAAVKSNILEKVESELYDFVEASKKSPTFSQFMKDLSVPKDARVKAVNEICAQAKFVDVTKNFLGMMIYESCDKQDRNKLMFFLHCVLDFHNRLTCRILCRLCWADAYASFISSDRLFFLNGGLGQVEIYWHVSFIC